MKKKCRVYKKPLMKAGGQSFVTQDSGSQPIPENRVSTFMNSIKQNQSNFKADEEIADKIEMVKALTKDIPELKAGGAQLIRDAKKSMTRKGTVGKLTEFSNGDIMSGIENGLQSEDQVIRGRAEEYAKMMYNSRFGGMVPELQMAATGTEVVDTEETASGSKVGVSDRNDLIQYYDAQGNIINNPMIDAYRQTSQIQKKKAKGLGKFARNKLDKYIGNGIPGLASTRYEMGKGELERLRDEGVEGPIDINSYTPGMGGKHSYFNYSLADDSKSTELNLDPEQDMQGYADEYDDPIIEYPIIPGKGPVEMSIKPSDEVYFDRKLDGLTGEPDKWSVKDQADFDSNMETWRYLHKKSDDNPDRFNSNPDWKTPFDDALSVPNNFSTARTDKEAQEAYDQREADGYTPDLPDGFRDGGEYDDAIGYLKSIKKMRDGGSLKKAQWGLFGNSEKRRERELRGIGKEERRREKELDEESYDTDVNGNQSTYTASDDNFPDLNTGYDEYNVNFTGPPQEENMKQQQEADQLDYDKTFNLDDDYYRSFKDDYPSGTSSEDPNRIRMDKVGKLKGWWQDSFGKNAPSNAASEGILAGMRGMTSGLMRREALQNETKYKQEISNPFNTYKVGEANPGDYMANAPGFGDHLKPNEHTRRGKGVQMAQQGFEVDAELDLTKEEIAALEAQGYEFY